MWQYIITTTALMPKRCGIRSTIRFVWCGYTQYKAAGRSIIKRVVSLFRRCFNFLDWYLCFKNVACLLLYLRGMIFYY